MGCAKKGDLADLRTCKLAPKHADRLVRQDFIEHIERRARRAPVQSLRVMI